MPVPDTKNTKKTISKIVDIISFSYYSQLLTIPTLFPLPQRYYYQHEPNILGIIRIYKSGKTNLPKVQLVSKPLTELNVYYVRSIKQIDHLFQAIPVVSLLIILKWSSAMAGQDKDKVPDWKALEQLVAMIQRQLSPDAIVQHNVMLDGVQSETKRQVDVLVEQRIGQYKMRIIIDCKDYASPVDVKGVEEFHGLVQDVCAHQGALVCPAGFSKAALRRAQKLQIALYRPVSTDAHKWQAKVTAPILCDFRDSLMSFGISCSAPKPLLIPNEFYKLPVYSVESELLGTALEVAQARWDRGVLPSEPGEHKELLIFEGATTQIDNGYGDKVEVTLTLTLFVKQNLYLGHLPVEDINGLQDEHTGYIVTNAFTLGGLNPDEIERNWQRVENVNSIKFEPLLKVVGYNCYGIGPN
ncbi:TPA: restriction endonuclease [Yersinia enterocolitica]|uniref:restriction endonuclease n=1 Tax=Yersinia enterocolitica TaxID=630 RepID=UPI00067A94EF|nr:restriction endonuclease [Yersinia enterocolitica]EKN3779378.1 restriction endonuclease [Yersinia enterocolitica]EKN4011147.1 restriction endonuclease [Yersinia enterocolitica]EKN4764263.1 restriction endonuclease [Yersinia enterocolitica]EKN4822792.1 restriction endonuclease [Yersinia enterocolitica]EKN6000772.1 restriction endonuclease [Yersinia enterocolitica]